MKKIITLVLGMLLCYTQAFSQVLFGSHCNGSSEISNTLHVPTKNFTNVNTLNGIKSLAQAETAYDPINGRYFNVTTSEIKIINTQSGLIIDSIPNYLRMRGIEYNINTDCLIGSYWNGSNEIFTTLDLTTKTFSNVAVLNGIQSLAQGETAFDANNDRYFNMTPEAITIINSQTGAIIDTINNALRFKGIEFNSNTGKLIGSHWNGTNELFTTLDLSTKIFTSIDTLMGVQYIAQGESAFDPSNNKYFNLTNLGITVIDAQSGNIMDTISNAIRFKGIELYYKLDKEKLNGGGLIVYPNPSENNISIVASKKNIGTTFYITDLSGCKMVTGKLLGPSTNIDISQLKSGCYIIRSEESKGTTFQKR